MSEAVEHAIIAMNLLDEVERRIPDYNEETLTIAEALELAIAHALTALALRYTDA